MGISKINASTLIIILVISVVTTLVVIQLPPEEYIDPSHVNLMENETLSFVEGIDTNNDSKFEYISFSVEFLLIAKGNFTLELSCSLGFHIDDVSIGGRILSIDDHLGYQIKGDIKRDYIILISSFNGPVYQNHIEEINIANFQIVFMLILEVSGIYDSVESPFDMGSHKYGVDQLDLRDPYEIMKVEYIYFNDTDSLGFETGEFNFTAYFRFAIVLELEFNMHIRSYNTSEFYSYAEEFTLNITEPQLYIYYFGLNFSECGKEFAYVKSIYYHFDLDFVYDSRMVSVSETIYY